MFYDTYEEHLRDSAPDNSRFDGFDRGDLGEPIAPVARAATPDDEFGDDIPF